MKTILTTKKVNKKLWPIVHIMSVVALIFSGSKSFSAAGPEWTRPQGQETRQATTAQDVFEKIKRNLISQREQSTRAYDDAKLVPSRDQQRRQTEQQAAQSDRQFTWQQKQTYNREAGILNMAKKADTLFNQDTYKRNLTELQKSGISIIQDQFGKTPLMWAAQNGKLAMARQLFQDNIASVDQLDFDGGSALRWAMNCPADTIVDMVQLLIQNGATSTINTKTTGVDWMTGQPSQRTPLQWLLRRHPHSMSKSLSLLDKATVYAVADQLIQAGADPLIQDKDGKTAIYWALALNDFDLALTLYNAPGVAVLITPQMQQSFVQAVFTSGMFMSNYADLITNLTRLLLEMGVTFDQRSLQQAAQAATANSGTTPQEINTLTTDIMQQIGIPAGQAAPARTDAPARTEKRPATTEYHAAPAAPPSTGSGLEDLTPEEKAWLAEEQRAAEQQAKKQAAPSASGYRQATPPQPEKSYPTRTVGTGFVPYPPVAAAPRHVAQPAAPAANQDQTRIDSRIAGLTTNINVFFNQPDWNSQNFKAHYFKNLDAIWNDAAAINYRPESLTKLKDRLVKYATGRQKKKGLGASETKAITEALQMSNQWQ